MKLSSLLLVSLIFVANTLNADGLYDGRTELGIHGGGIFYESDSDLKEALVYGLRLGRYFTNNIEIEASALYGEGAISGLPGTATTLFPSLEGQYHFGHSRFRPFLAAGGGALIVNRDGGKNDTDFTVPYGGGLKWLAGRGFTLRMDLRHLINFDSDQTMNNLLLTGGISWIFGGKHIVKIKKPKLKDLDKDGVWDHVDRCPASPEGVKVDRFGCSIEANPIEEKFTDTDGDGVYDLLDKCPGTPTKTLVGTDGCKLPKTTTIDIDIKFDTGRSTFSPGYRSEIMKVVRFLKKYPTVTAVIEGHTDNVGNEGVNKRLSQNRAESVRHNVIKEGEIDPTRIKAIGYGSSKPIAANNTPEGRQKNRRVVATMTVTE